MAKKHILIPDLQLFADGAAGAADGTGGGTPGTGATGDIAADAARQAKGGKNPLADVIYGKQPETSPPEADAQAAAAQQETETAEARKARYEAFRKEFKAELDAETQETVKKRLKNSKETVDKYTAMQPVMQMLGSKYGVDPGDAAAIAKALEDDDSYYERDAMEMGVSVEQLKHIRKIERENRAMTAQLEEANREKQVEQDISRWMGEAEEAKKVFPNLDLGAELQNPQFVELLKSNIDVQTAYWAVHSRELVPQMMQYAAAKTQQQVAQNIAAGAARPTENGTLATSAAVVKSDVSKLTRADREEIIRRVQRGERITF